jgi:hypothetical protein
MKAFGMKGSKVNCMAVLVQSESRGTYIPSSNVPIEICSVWDRACAC